MNTIEAVFLDRDGTIGGGDTIHYPGAFELYPFTQALICPHLHDEGCGCRKPGIEMLLRGAAKYQLHLENCAVIGDRWSDMAAAHKVNCVKILVKTGAGQSMLDEHRDKISGLHIDYVARDLADAVDWLYRNFNMEKE